jgi:hypothetical protein
LWLDAWEFMACLGCGVAALVGTPVGYLWANPAAFADDPEVMQAPHWGSMFEYMALFGVTGVLYAAGANRQRKRA